MTSNLEFALKLARSIENEIIKAITLAKLACITKNREILKEALDIVEKMDLLHSSETLSKIAVVMAEAGKFEDAIKFANDVVEERFRLEALETITAYLCDARKFDKALEITSRLRYRSQRALSNISIKLAMNGNFKKSMEVAEMIKEKSWKAETFAKLANFDLKNQKKLFEKSLKIVNSINDGAIKSQMLLKIALEMAKAKMNFNKILKEGLNTEKNDMDLLSASVNFLKIGEVDKALEIASSIRSRYFKAEALAKIASVSDVGLFDDAMEIAENIKDNSTSIEALSKIAVEMAKSGRDNTNVIAEISRKLEDLDDFERSKVLTNVVIDFIEMEDVEGAIELSNSITDEIYRSEALFYITTKLVKINEFGRAVEISSKIPNSYWKSKALAEISVKLATLG